MRITPAVEFLCRDAVALRMITSSTRRSACLLLASTLTSLAFRRTACAANEASNLNDAAVKTRITAGLALLDKIYWCPVLHLWFRKPGDELHTYYEGRLNPPWWSSANAVETVLDAMRLTGDESRLPALAAMWEQHQANPDQAPVVIAELKRQQKWTEADDADFQRKPRTRLTSHAGYRDFNNEYLDDSGWWGITWLKMYDRTKDAKYLATAKAIHAHMATHWQTEAGGGVLWQIGGQRPYINAITNSLFLILSARLHQTTHDEAYLKWAHQTRDWFHKSNLYDGTAVVDGVGHHNDHWTYNAGAWIGGLTTLYATTGDQAVLDEAVAAADSAMHRAGFFRDGVLVEKLGFKSWDPCLFKGILMRYLGQLRDVLRVKKLHPATADEIDKLLRSSATAMIAAADKDGQFGVQWQKDAPGQEYQFNSHTSGLMALVAVPRIPPGKSQ